MGTCSQGWTVAQTAREFLVEPATAATWLKRLDEEEADPLVQLSQPVNRFPDFVRYIVQRLKVLCPPLGKRKIAQMLARAGLHLGTTTIQRVLKEKPAKPPVAPGEAPIPTGRVVTADYPDHVHHVDLTVVPTSPGLWASWLPFALPQAWPFAWWVAIVIDHFSRRVMGVAVFKKQPTSVQVRMFLGRLYAKRKPKYIVCDKGSQFWCHGFKAWCKRKGIEPRFGAVGKYGSISLIERFIRSMKSEGLRMLAIPLQLQKMRAKISLYVAWYNGYRPHQALNGRTPDELRRGAVPANRRRRYEPRKRWPTEGRCAAPQASIKGERDVRLGLRVDFFEGRRHLPVVELRSAA